MKSLAAIPMFVAEAIVMVSVAIIVMSPITTTPISVRSVVRRRKCIRFNDGDSGQADAYADEGTCLGGHTGCDPGDPESSTTYDRCNFVHGGNPR